MATLSDFAHTMFPHHQLAPWESTRPGEPAPLAAHTVVVEVIGPDKAREIHAALQDLTFADIRAIDVEPDDPTVLPTHGEDPGGPVDVPRERVAVAAVAGAVLGALALGLLGAVVLDATAGVAIAALFGLGLGTAVGFIVGGGRHAGERATVQPEGVAGRRISLLAVMLDNESEALTLVRSLEARGVDPDVEYRIVGTDGGWHSPAT